MKSSGPDVYCGKISDNKFNFSNRYKVNPYFLSLVSVLVSCIFQGIFKFVKFTSIKLLVAFSYYSFNGYRI